MTSALQIVAPTGVVTVPTRKRRIPYVVRFSIGWLVLLVVVTACRGLLPLPAPGAIDYTAVLVPPFTDMSHPLGTDAIGRDMLSRLLLGAQVSLIVGVGSISLAFLAGITLGMLGAYFGRWSDRMLGALIDILLAFPPLIAVIALSVFMGPSLFTVVLALGLVFTPQVARVSRTSALGFVERDFVIASKLAGASHARLVWKEVTPNVVVPVLSYAVVLIAVAIGAEGGLSFLGVGVPPPNSSWGTMMGEGRAVLAVAPYVVLIPAFTMFLTLLSINYIADFVSKRFDIKEAGL